MSRRRRQLFPSEESIDGDLGSITPINTQNDEELLNSKLINKNNNTTMQENVLLEGFSSDEESNITLTQSTPSQKNVYTESMSPLYLSPQVSTIAYNTRKRAAVKDLDTPNKSSLDFPVKVPKLSRKSLDDEAGKLDKTPTSNENENTLNYNKGSKVRTTLFPEVPTKKFYPKTVQFTKTKPQVPKTIVVTKKRKKYVSNKNRYGQINAGVRHFIKKPKKPVSNKEFILKAAELIIDNSPLNQFFDTSTKKQNNQVEKYHEKIMESLEFQDYLKELSNISTPAPKLIQNATVSATTKENRKRVGSPVSTPQKKYKTTTPESNSAEKTTLDFDFSANATLVNSQDIDNLINILDDGETVSETSSPSSFFANPNTVVLTAHNNSITASDNSILLHESQHENLLMSPTSVMCNMASGLALNSPRKSRDLSYLINSVPVAPQSDNVLNELPYSDMEKKKLFPVFDFKNRTDNKEKKCAGSPCSAKKLIKKLPSDQMLLDAGQKKFGAEQCGECKLVYHVGDPNDEILHTKYHDNMTILRFGGWKNERVVELKPNKERIIQVLPNDPTPWLKKICDILEVVNNELGFYDTQAAISNCQVYIYIKNKQVVGCLVAEARDTAFQLLSTNTEIDFCSESAYAIKCGVSRVWVFPKSRKSGIATAMMNCLKKNFMPGYVLSNNDIAFSSPSEMGKQFGTGYFKTPNFLIYM